MNCLVFLSLSLAFFGITTARMPAELSKMLGLVDEQVEPKTPLSSLQEELNRKPDTFMGSDFDLSKYLSESPSNMASVEIARRKLGSGDVEQYMPAPIQRVECHVEFQVTERVPGRCTRLAGSIPACQAEKYIGINYNECS